jgi:hypothetical protein
MNPNGLPPRVAIEPDRMCMPGVRRDRRAA